MANDYHNAHEVVKGDPRVDGPYLDDVRADQERAYREHRNKNAEKDFTRHSLTPVAEETVSGGDSVEVVVTDAQPGLFDETESKDNE